MKKSILFPLLAAFVLLSSSALCQDGKVKIRIQTNENGTVTTEEKEFDLSDGIDLDQILEDQNIDINIDDLDGKKMVEIIVNGQSSSLDFDTESDRLEMRSDFFGKGNCDMSSKEAEQLPFLGVHYNNSYSGDGVLISEVVEESTAEEMGLRVGDIITDFGGTPIHTFGDLANAVKANEIGSTILVRFEREGKSKKTTAALGHKTVPARTYYSDNDDSEVFGFKFDKEEFGQDFEDMMHALEERMESYDFGEKFNSKEFENMMSDLEKKFNELDFNMDSESGSLFNSRAIIIIQDIDERDLADVNAQADPKLSSEDNLSLDELRFFPNPSNGQFDLSFSSADRGDLNVMIYDAKGQKVYYEMLGDFSGAYNNNIDISTRPAGNYFLQIIQNSKTYSKKLVKE